MLILIYSAILCGMYKPISSKVMVELATLHHVNMPFGKGSDEASSPRAKIFADIEYALDNLPDTVGTGNIYINE